MIWIKNIDKNVALCNNISVNLIVARRSMQEKANMPAEGVTLSGACTSKDCRRIALRRSPL